MSIGSPTDRCTSCGVEFENSHYSCQGHQNCLPECPVCGGDLEEIQHGDA